MQRRKRELNVADGEGFYHSVALPPQLKIAHIRSAIDYIEEQMDDFVDVYYEQANVFSALVGIFGVRALHALSAYKRPGEHLRGAIIYQHPRISVRQRGPILTNGGNAQ